MVHLLAERFVLCALFFETLPAESSVCELLSRISSQVVFSLFCEVFMSNFSRFISNSYLLLAFCVHSYYGVAVA
jgi:hypothetical protein